ncbi:hypothetical protein D621_09625 [beta proteobacterium AAP51]|nr:hypothetical protein D621_09625 [beta proteobacterium AAP51]
MKFTVTVPQSPALPRRSPAAPRAKAAVTPPAVLPAQALSAQALSAPKPRAQVARRRVAQRRPRVSRLLAWLLAAWLGPIGLSLAQVAPGTLPAGGQVVVGSGVLQHAPNLLVIQQNSQKLGLDWQSFNIGPGATVEFRQPGAGAVALNRVLGHSGTEIYGQLKANGQVFLTNPNGVLFAPGAKVDVGGLVASTLDLSQQDFANGHFIFQHTGGRGAVVNQGQLNASAGGYVALFGNRVANAGDIHVDAGSVVLAAGRAATVSISGSGLVSAVVTPGTLDGQVDHSGRIMADGGVVTMTAKSAQDVAASLVNSSGIVRANTVVERAGEIWITGDQVASSGSLSVAAPAGGDAGRIVVKGDLQGGSLKLAGRIDATAAQGRGGEVETSAAHVSIANETRVDSRGGQATGTWLIDPTDFTVAAGGGAQTTSGIGADTLSANLATANVTLQTALAGSEPGDIHVNAPVAWSANTTLTLEAARDININASITATGLSAGLQFITGAGRFFNVNATSTNRPTVSLSGANATLRFGTTPNNLVGYTLVRDLAGLQAMGSGLAGRYALMADIDASSTASNGFVPIGNETATSVTTTGAFTGVFDGMGHRITGLTINRPTSNATGLFANLNAATVRNFELLGGTVTGSQYVGAVAGYTQGAATLHNIRSNMAVVATEDGSQGVWGGGLVGRLDTNAIGVLRSHTTGTVAVTALTSTAAAGGVVGQMNAGQLTDVSASGSVTQTLSSGTGDSSHYAGGVVGVMNTGTVSGATASSPVTGTRWVGGLIGYSDSTAALSGLSASGNVTASSTQGVAGGLAGRTNGAVNSSSASGNVSGGGDVGGLVGRAQGAGGFSNVSATGTVTSSSNSFAAGGLVGAYSNTGNLSNANASGAVQGPTGGNSYAGGLVGWFSTTASINTVETALTSTVSGGGSVGGLVGYATGTGTAAITGATARGAVTGSPTQGNVGGLVGDFNLNGGFSNVSAQGTVSGGLYAGGLVGYYSSAAAITGGSYTGGTVSGSGWAGGLVGYMASTAAISGPSSANPLAVAANVTTTGTSGAAGGVVGRSAGVLANLSSSGTVTAGNEAGGVVGRADGAGGLSQLRATGNVSSSSTSASVGGVVGYQTNSGGLNTATGTGNVSGGRYTGGVVGYYSANGNVATLRAEGAVSGAGDAGGVIGYADGTGSLTGADALGTVSSSATTTYSVGGAVGYFSMDGGLSGVSAAGNVSGGVYTGGVIGYYQASAAIPANALTYVNSASRSVSGITWVGGLIGYSNATAIGAHTVAASVTGTATSGAVGGLAGRTAGSLVNSSASGAVTSASVAGGLVGQAEGTATFTDVSASGAVRGVSSAGGLVGNYNSNARILRGTASGTVFTSTTGGGLVGSHYGGIIEASSASGAVTGLSDSVVYIGGLVGDFGANCYFCAQAANYTITGSSATGAVRADASTIYAGGLVGFTYSGNIVDSNASGSVTGRDSVSTNSNEYLGGLVGYFGNFTNIGNITGSNATGAVSGGYYTGGLAGYFNGTTLRNSTASGRVSDGWIIGGLAGGATLYGAMENVSASGDVIAPSTSVSGAAGGLIGELFLTATTSLNTGASVTNASASGTVAVGRTSGAVGGLFGNVNTSTNTLIGPINDSRATGNVSGGSSTGGLIGAFFNSGSSALLNSHATGTVTGGSTAGGLVGDYSRTSSNAGRADDITNSFATGAVSGSVYVGGLVGDFDGRIGITGSHATGNVTARDVGGTKYLGGLVGLYTARHTSATVRSSITASYATGTVRLGSNPVITAFTDVFAGGLVGYVSGTLAAAALVDTYATGAVTLTSTNGRLYAGGLVGFGVSGQTVLRSYASGAVSATGGNQRFTGGLLAGRGDTVVGFTDSYWNSTTTGQSTSVGGGTALSDAQMRQAASFTGWSLATTGAGGSTWRIYEGYTAPLLSRFLTPRTLTLADASKVYDGTLSFGNATLTAINGSITFPERIFVATPSSDVGSYNVAAAGVYSVQNGYDLTVTGSATLTVTPRPITLAGVVADKVYDGTRTATLLATAQPSGIVTGQSLTVNTAGATAVFDTRNVGQNKAVTITGLSLADGPNGKASNYLLADSSSSTASITPATLNVGGFTATNRAYDGSTTVAVSTGGGTVSGVLGSDNVSVNLSGVNSGTIADKNVGTAKPVTVLGAVLSGSDAGNYVLGGISNVTVNITPRTLTVNGLLGNNRTYNQATTVSVPTGVGVLSGAVAGDVLQLRAATVTGTMADRHVGTGKSVTVPGTSLLLRGQDATNYTVADAVATVNIAPATINLFADLFGTGRDKVYDGTDVAGVTPYFNSNIFGGLVAGTQTVGPDTITLGHGTPRYVSKNVVYSGGNPTTQTITVSGATLSGPDAGNYVLGITTSTTSGRITPRSLAVTGVNATNRVYDGTVNVSVNVAGATVDTSTVVPGDNVTVAVPGSGTVVGTMANKNVGTAKPVAVPGFSLGGTDAGNYTLSGSSGVTVNITPRPLTAVYTALDKVYNGNANAELDITSADIVAGDVVRFLADTSDFAGFNCIGCYSAFVTPTSTPTNFTRDANAGVNKRVVAFSNALFGTDAANYTLLNPTAILSASITPRGITPVFTGVNKVYDGDTTATVNVNTSASGILSGDAVSLTRTATFADRNVGTGKAISITGIAFTGAAAGNYTLTTTTASATASITPRPLAVAGVTGVDRAYDGSTTVALTVGALGASGVVGSDVVTVNAPVGGLGNGTMANKAVGQAKAVTVAGLTLSGADAGNYSIDGTQGVTVNITPRPLTATYTGQTREYNGGVSASVTAGSADIVPGDVLSFTQNAIFTGLDGRNVGSNKPISVTSIVLSGADSSNYALVNTTASTTGSITPKAITVSYNGLARVYNGLADTSANVAGFSFALVDGDQVSFTQTASFTGNGAVGVGKPVVISNIAIGGPQGANYALLNTTATTTASITPRQLGVTGVIAADRVYDGSTVVQLSTSGATVLPAGVLAGDDVSIVLPSGGITTGTMATKDAGSNKPVSITGLSLSGASAANYAVGGTGLTVNITPRPLTALYAAASRVYDGTTLASVTGTSTDILAGDIGALGISANGQFTGGKNVGTDKAVAVSGGFLTGAERNNYSLVNPVGSALASITPRPLTAAFTGGTRVYDGGVAAPVTATGAGVLSGDQVGFTQTAVFTGTGAKNVGTGKAIAISNVALTGSDAMNYALLGTTASATGSITRKPISIDGITGASATPRVYDGTVNVAVVLSGSGSLSPSSADIVAGDDVTISLPPGGITSGSMQNKNAGTNKAVTIDGLQLSGLDSGNYEVAGTTGITVNIAQRLLNAVYTGNTRAYDGSVAATVTGSSTDLLAGDVVNITGAGSFTGPGARNAGVGKPILITSASLSGADAINYALVNAGGTTTGTITPRLLNPAYTGLAKVYDGTTLALVAPNTSGFVLGDAVQFGQTAVFTGDKNVGSNKAISITGITLSGADAANYQLTATTAGTVGSITPRPLRIDGLLGVTATDRVYDGSLLVSVQVNASGPIAPNPADLVPGDVVTVNAPGTGTTTGSLLDKNVGNAKPVTVAGLNLAGPDAGNYSIAATSGVTVNITPRPLTAVYTAPAREYDGTTTATLTGSSADIIAGDVLSITGTGVFTGAGARNAGTGKAIDILSVSFGGADAANYSLLNPTGTATGTITPRNLTVSFLGGTRVYDGLVNAPVTGTLDRLVAGDDARLVQTAVFTGPGARNVGVNKAVAITGIGLTGADATNYSLATTTASTTATLTPRPLRILGFTGVVATDRVYDGTTAVAITATGSGTISANPDDIVSGDNVGVVAPPTGTTAGLMADKNVGNNKPVTVAGITLSGSDAGNYTVAAAAGVTVNITPKPLTAVWAGLNRVYDGTADVTIAGSSADIFGSDLVTLTGSGLFTGTDAKNVGTGKAIAVTGGLLGGADALNYSLLNPTGSATANVTPRTLVASYTGGTRVYDGSITAPVTGTLAGLVAGDDLGFTQTAVFVGGSARDAGEGKLVQISGITLSGADAVNYSLLSNSLTTTASVTRRPLNVGGLSGLTAVDRVYDGTRDVAVTGTLVIGSTSLDLVAGDDVSLTLPAGNVSAGLMTDKAVGTGKAVAVVGLGLAGVHAGNYQITGTAGLTVNIAPRPVQLLGVTAQDRVYDGSTLVAINATGGSLNGVLPGDDVQLLGSGVTGTLADKNVGTGKAVSLSGLGFGGVDVGNYRFEANNLSVNITPRTLLPTMTVAGKVYDGNANASITLLGDALAGDVVSLTAASALFANANAGENRSVTASGLALAGVDAGNYQLATTTLTGSAAIQRRALTVAANSLSKIYGESLDLRSASFSVEGLVAGETLGSVVLTSAGSAPAADAGSYALNIGSASGGSFNPDNYLLTYSAGTLSVQPRPLTIAANSLVLFADEPIPATLRYSSSEGGLVGNDQLGTVPVQVRGQTQAAGVRVLDLVPGNASFAQGNAANYDITYGRGLLLVLPTPPRLDDGTANAGEAGGGQQLGVVADPAEVARAVDALVRNANVVAQPRTDESSPAVAALPPTREAAAEALAALLSGDGARVSLPELQRLPLISFEPTLRRLLTGAPPATPARTTP